MCDIIFSSRGSYLSIYMVFYGTSQKVHQISNVRFYARGYYLSIYNDSNILSGRKSKYHPFYSSVCHDVDIAFMA